MAWPNSLRSFVNTKKPLLKSGFKFQCKEALNTINTGTSTATITILTGTIEVTTFLFAVVGNTANF
jgi:hypothetical protein